MRVRTHLLRSAFYCGVVERERMQGAHGFHDHSYSPTWLGLYAPIPHLDFQVKRRRRLHLWVTVHLK
jgi:hypothetical protein